MRDDTVVPARGLSLGRVHARFVLALAAWAAVVLAGCGGGSGSSAGPDSARPPPSEAGPGDATVEATTAPEGAAPDTAAPGDAADATLEAGGMVDAASDSSWADADADASFGEGGRDAADELDAYARPDATADADAADPWDLPDAAGCEGGRLFAPTVLGGGTSLRVLLKDMNADGILDIVTSNGGPNIALGHGDGTFAPATFWNVGFLTDGIDVGDVDGDGLLDVALGGDKPFTILRGTAGGNFAPPVSYAARTASEGLKLGDVDGDGHLDAVAAIDGSVAVFRNLGDGTFGAPVYYDLAGLNGPGDLALADLNGDLAPDIVTQVSWSGTVAVFLNDGHGGFGPAKELSVGSGTQERQFAVADVTGDGVYDILAPHGNQLALLVGVGDGTFMRPRQYHVGSPVTGIGVGDFNGDGVPDLAPFWGVGGAGAVVYLGTGSDFVYQGSYNAIASPGPAAAAYLNGDQRADLVVGEGTGPDAILLSTGCLQVTADAGADATSE